MAPSLVSTVAGTAFLAASALATDQVYKLQENWEKDQFFNQFDFFQVG